MKARIGFLSMVVIFFFILCFDTPAQNIIRVPADYPTIQGAVDAAGEGDLILVSPGDYAGAVVNKRVTIRGLGQARIVEGVPWMPGSFLSQTAFRLDILAGGDGAKIIHFTIECDEEFCYGVYSYGADDVTVSRLTINNCFDGIVNYNGNGWQIIHNRIEGFPDGGDGIIIGEYIAREASNNLVAFNRIVDPEVPDNYSTTPGIILASYYNGMIRENKVVYNRIRLGGYDDACGVELYDGPGGDTGDLSVIDNQISYNDFRGCSQSFIFYPDEDQGDEYDVKSANDFSHNKGDDL
jgi:hypothetical protein